MEQKNEERRAVACHYYEYYLALEKKLQRLEIRIARERYEELKN